MKGIYIHTKAEQWENHFIFGSIYMIKFYDTVIHSLDMDVLVNYRKLE